MPEEKKLNEIYKNDRVIISSADKRIPYILVNTKKGMLNRYLVDYNLMLNHPAVILWLNRMRWLPKFEILDLNRKGPLDLSVEFDVLPNDLTHFRMIPVYFNDDFSYHDEFKFILSVLTIEKSYIKEEKTIDKKNSDYLYYFIPIAFKKIYKNSDRNEKKGASIRIERVIREYDKFGFVEFYDGNFADSEFAIKIFIPDYDPIFWSALFKQINMKMGYINNKSNNEIDLLLNNDFRVIGKIYNQNYWLNSLFLNETRSFHIKPLGDLNTTNVVFEAELKTHDKGFTVVTKRLVCKIYKNMEPNPEPLILEYLASKGYKNIPELYGSLSFNLKINNVKDINVDKELKINIIFMQSLVDDIEGDAGAIFWSDLTRKYIHKLGMFQFFYAEGIINNNLNNHNNNNEARGKKNKVSQILMELYHDSVYFAKIIGQKVFELHHYMAKLNLSNPKILGSINDDLKLRELSNFYLRKISLLKKDETYFYELLYFLSLKFKYALEKYSSTQKSGIYLGKSLKLGNINVTSAFLDLEYLLRNIQAHKINSLFFEYFPDQIIHQDLHLGQILQIKSDKDNINRESSSRQDPKEGDQKREYYKDWNETSISNKFIFLDFEGDPQLDYEERLKPQSIFMDLGSLIRSFSYIKINSFIINSYDYDNEAKYPNIYGIPPGMLKGRDLSQVTSALNSLIKNFYGSLKKIIEKFQNFYKDRFLKRDLLLMIYSSLILKKITQLRSKFQGNFGNQIINQYIKKKKYNQFNLSLLEGLGKLLAQFLDFYSYSNKIIKNKYSNDFKFLNWFMNNIHSQDQPHISD
ncbi:MAG: hypothetical protein ACTSVC_07940, partial [Promethearchaeota archaeon]